ncbi:hypothetical protein ACKVV7_011236 [Pyricularia oryzae]
MRFIFPLVIAGLAHVALAAPVRSSESAHSIVSRGTEVYGVSTGEVLSKRAAVIAAGAYADGYDSDGWGESTEQRKRRKQREKQARERKAEEKQRLNEEKAKKQAAQKAEREAQREAKAAMKKQAGEAGQKSGCCGLLPGGN